MEAVLAFAVVLLLAALVSELANRSVLSTAVLFLIGGFLVGEGVLNLVPLAVDPNAKASESVIYRFADLALFSVLFSDGMKVGLRDLRGAWKLPGRALLLGMPLTFGITALLAHFVAGLDWPAALLIGAVLSPTDPVFAAAIVGRKEVPVRLRRLLNVESGVNDGLALPFVIIFLAMVAREEIHALEIATELLLGIVFGVVIPFVAIKLEQTRFFAATHTHKPIFALAIGLVLYALCYLTHANAYLAAFGAGITIATLAPDVKDAFHEFGELIAELLKLAALLVFGALISPQFLTEISWQGYLFAFLALVAARPLALRIAMPPQRHADQSHRLSRLEWLAAAWFGPKGFASVVYGLLVLASDVPFALKNELFHLIAISIAFSILAHSSTDVVVARWFLQDEPPQPDVDEEGRRDLEPAI